MPELFEPVTVAGMTLRNRFMRSATAERLAEPDGTPTPELAAMMAELARGEVGLIVVGHTFVRPDGKASRGMAGLWRDEQVAAFRQVAAAAQAEGAAICVQINHAGRQGDAALTGQELVAPSRIAPSEGSPTPRALSEPEIWDLIEAYGKSARRVREAGFDCVQIHGAHGYLISQFLSPATNHRHDQWGGSIENRARFMKEVARSVRENTGPDYPVLIKLGLADFLPGGLSLEDGLEVVAMLESLHIDLLEISGGIGAGNARTRIVTEEDEAYFLPWARGARQKTQLPIALVGGIRSLKIMGQIVNEGAADLISLSRPLIREPNLVKKLANRIEEKATCISCNQCSTHRDEKTQCWVK